MDLRRGSLALALLLGGCSQLFGLDTPQMSMPDSPTVDPTDSDGDGHSDSVDNCPNLRNPDQTDTDNDQIGDACQGCTMLPLRAIDDDDADMVNDTIDNCIGLSGGSADSDLDGIGSGCDPSALTDARFCVWTFRNPATGEDNSVWSSHWQLSGGFVINDSVLAHPMSMQQLDVATLSNESVDSDTGVAFDTRIHMMAYTVPMVVGFGIELQGTMPTQYTCQVIEPSGGGAGKVQLVKDGLVVDEATFPIAVPMAISTYVRVTAARVNGLLQVRCSLDTLPGSYSVGYDDPTAAQTLRVRPRAIADHCNVELGHVTAYKLGIRT